MYGKVIGYGCVASSQHSVKDDRFLSDEEIEWRKNTKVAEEFKKLRNLFLSDNVIVIDVIGGSYRRRHHLEYCIKTMGHGDSIVIANLNSLGLNNEELLENYKRIFEKGIGVLLPDYSLESCISPLSTTDFSFSPISISVNEFEEKCKIISSVNISSNRGRKTIKITEEFKDVYWLYERYLIDPITANKNKFFNISKNTFRKLATEYENCEEYITALEYQDKIYNISGLPKRYGVISTQIQELIHDVSVTGIPFKDACSRRGIKISKIQFDRYLLKFYCPKGATLKKTFELRDYDLIESLQPVYDRKT
ncbi:MAG: hypothetical protein PUH54_00835 [Oscillospiraceae bacterium]|nr:hypothetical protein [Oscillospiraceae bacterium]